MVNFLHRIWDLSRPAYSASPLQQSLGLVIEGADEAYHGGFEPIAGSDYDGTLNDTRTATSRLIKYYIEKHGTRKMKEVLAEHPPAGEYWSLEQYMRRHGEFSEAQIAYHGRCYYNIFQSRFFIRNFRRLHPHVDGQFAFYRQLGVRLVVITNKARTEAPPAVLLGAYHDPDHTEVFYNERGKVNYAGGGRPQEQLKGDMLRRYLEQNPGKRVVVFSENAPEHITSVARATEGKIPIIAVAGDVPPYDSELSVRIEEVGDAGVTGKIVHAYPKDIAYAFENIRVRASDYALGRFGLRTQFMGGRIFWGGAEVGGTLAMAALAPFISARLFNINPEESPFTYQVASLGTMHAGSAVMGSATDVARSIFHTSGRFAAARVGGEMIITRSVIATGTAAAMWRVAHLQSLVASLPWFVAGEFIAEHMGLGETESLVAGLALGFGISSYAPRFFPLLSRFAPVMGLAILAGQLYTAYKQQTEVYT